jgi:hypothetical protein
MFYCPFVVIKLIGNSFVLIDSITHISPLVALLELELIDKHLCQI